MKKRRYFRSVKSAFFLALCLHLLLIFSLVMGYPIYRKKDVLQIPYRVKLVKPVQEKTSLAVSSKKQKKSTQKTKNKTTSHRSKITSHPKKRKQKPIKKKTALKHRQKKHIRKKKKAISLKSKKKQKNNQKQEQKSQQSSKSTRKQHNPINRAQQDAEERKLQKKLAEIERHLKEKEEEEYLKKRLASLQKNIEKSSKTSPAKDEDIHGRGSASSSVLQRYAEQIWMKVRSNWHFPAYLLKDSQIEAVVAITIDKNGKILNKHFERRSGFAAFDRSVLKAIADSNPLPPLPKALGTGPIEMGIRFNPNRMGF